MKLTELSVRSARIAPASIPARIWRFGLGIKKIGIFGVLNMAKIVNLRLAFRWFEEVESGRKTSEYRKACGITGRLLEKMKPGDMIVFHKGYTGTHLRAKVTAISTLEGWQLPDAEREFFGLCNDTKFFKIDFEKMKRPKVVEVN